VRFSTDGLHLRTNWNDAEKRRARVPASRLLGAFCNLGRMAVSTKQRRGEIHRFARQFGLLGLCEKHRVPAAGCRHGCPLWQWKDQEGIECGAVDALRDWVLWARRFEGTVRLARTINKAQQPRPADVEEAFLEVEGWQARRDLFRDPTHDLQARYIHDDGSEEMRAPLRFHLSRLLADGTTQPLSRRHWERQGPAIEAFNLRRWLNELLELAAVQRRVVAGRGPNQLLAITDAFADSCPLFGTLVVELIGACTGVASQARCANLSCQRGFRPTHQNQRYCARCRKAGVPLKLAQQNRRNRLRAEGKSARGRPLRSY
jgi:hypothetical protein